MRKDARENAFMLIFENLFHEDCDETLSKQMLKPVTKEEDVKFLEEIMQAFHQHKDETRVKIEHSLKKFSYDRLFKVDLALVQLALTEIYFLGTEKPIVINEVLELAKKYSTDKSHKFINGLLSAILDENNQNIASNNQNVVGD